MIILRQKEFGFGAAFEGFSGRNLERAKESAKRMKYKRSYDLSNLKREAIKDIKITGPDILNSESKLPLSMKINRSARRRAKGIIKLAAQDAGVSPELMENAVKINRQAKGKRGIA
jgi:hypothetical protein